MSREEMAAVQPARDRLGRMDRRAGEFPDVYRPTHFYPSTHIFYVKLEIERGVCSSLLRKFGC